LTTRILFPRLLVVGATLFFTGSAIAQSNEPAPRPTIATTTANAAINLADPSKVNTAEEQRTRTVTPVASLPAVVVPTIEPTKLFDQSLLTAMQSHLGASYHYNRTGPGTFDCSGFVWRSFQDIGLNFQRGPARSYWATMPAPLEGEQFKFGTLVFFGHLRHVGIVVDEKGFYHSARHGGVMYSPFNKYWLSRIDGFRRVPLPSTVPVVAAAAQRTAKAATTAVPVEER
jgi:cell wall-associated NlpC family hydrolase